MLADDELALIIWEGEGGALAPDPDDVTEGTHETEMPGRLDPPHPPSPRPHETRPMDKPVEPN